MRRNRHRGFTLIEMAVVVAIIAVLAALAFASIARQRPRATLTSATSELHSLVHYARQSALASGQDVAVMFFPDLATGAGATGRVIVYRDSTFDFFTGGATGGATFDAYAGGTLSAGVGSEVLATFDLPRGVTFGPVAGMGAGAALTAPLDQVVVSSFCSFCKTSGDRRGAIRFNPRGSPTFYGAGAGVSTPLPVTSGASLSLQSSDLTGQHTLVVTAPAGALTVVQNG